MNGIAFQSESHQDGLDAQNLFEVADDGDTSSAAYGERTFAESHGESLLSSLVSRQRDGADIAFASVHGSYFHLYIIGRGGFQVFDKEP